MAKTVQWYHNDTFIGEGTEAPDYLFVWDNPPVGTHNIIGRIFEDGVDLEVSDTVTITVIADPNQDTEPPTAPTGLTTVTIGEYYVDLKWNPSTDNVGVVEYNLYLDGEFRKKTTTADTATSGLTANTEYTAYVTAVDAEGNESEPSNEIVFTTDPVDEGDTEAPTAPSGFTSTDKTSTTVGLAWEASTDNEGISKYKVYKDGVFEKETISLSTIIVGLTPDTEYTFTVSAVDTSDNESVQSTSVTVITDPEESGELTINIVSPTEGSHYSEGSNITITTETN